MYNTYESLWRMFAVSGDPFAYLEYTKLRNEANKDNENDKSTGIDS